MKIGIVSAPKHCKTHIRSLRREGYNIHCLGDNPKGIPPSYDVVVVRVASSSHQGVTVARDWSRTTGKPSLYENGLSGIRAALKDMTALPNSKPVVTSSEMTLETARHLMQQWGETIHEARPAETVATMQEHLKATLRREYPDQYSFWAPLIPALCTEIVGLPSPHPTEPTPAEKECPMRPFPSVPSSAPWGRVYTPPKLQHAVKAAQTLIGELGPESIAGFREAYLRCEAQPSVELWKWVCQQPEYLMRGAKRTVFCGKPVVYVAFVYLLFYEDTPLPARLKRTFYTSYRSLTCKGADTRITDAVAWYLGFPDPLESPIYHKAMASRKSKKNSPKKGEVGGGATTSAALPARVIADIDENTRTLCALMDGVKALREEHTKEIGALRVEMEGALRQTQPDSDPFAALEEVKHRLAVLGFKGTLTITIE